MKSENRPKEDKMSRGGERDSGGEGECEKYVHCALLGDGMVGKTSLTLSHTQQVFTDRYTATVFDNYPVPVKVRGEDFVISVFDTAGQSDYESARAYTYQSSEVLVLCFSVGDRQSFFNVVNFWLPEIQRHTKGKLPIVLVGTQVDQRPSASNSTSDSSVPDLSSSPQSASSSPSSASCSRSPSSVSSSSTCSTMSTASTSSSSSASSSSSSSPSSSSPSSSSPSSSSPFSTEGLVSQEEGQELASVIGADCYVECSARTGEGLQQVFEQVVLAAFKLRKRKKKGIFGRLFRPETRLSKKNLRDLQSRVPSPSRPHISDSTG